MSENKEYKLKKDKILEWCNECNIEYASNYIELISKNEYILYKENIKILDTFSFDYLYYFVKVKYLENLIKKENSIHPNRY